MCMACVRACVRACVCVRVRVCVCGGGGGGGQVTTSGRASSGMFQSHPPPFVIGTTSMRLFDDFDMYMHAYAHI